MRAIAVVVALCASEIALGGSEKAIVCSGDRLTLQFAPDDFRLLSFEGRGDRGQFTALYGASGRGFFYSSRDGQGWQKILDVHFFPGRPSARIEMTHAPLNLGFPSENFSMPYPAVAGFFKGDWYDVCQLYRKWAIRQVWCRKGPLAGRTDIPQWLKDASVMVRPQTKTDAAVAAAPPKLMIRFAGHRKIPPGVLKKSGGRGWSLKSPLGQSGTCFAGCRRRAIYPWRGTLQTQPAKFGPEVRHRRTGFVESEVH